MWNTSQTLEFGDAKMTVNLMPSTFFGCLPLRIGAFSAALFTIILCILELGMLPNILPEAKKKMKEKEESCNDEPATISETTLIVTVLLICLWMALAFLLIIATLKKRTIWIAGWISFSTFMEFALILGTFEDLACFRLYDYKNRVNYYKVAELVGVIGMICMQFYLILIVASYYKKLKADAALLPPSYSAAVSDRPPADVYVKYATTDHAASV